MDMPQTNNNQKFIDLRDNFDFLDDWEDRYKYLIELGSSLAPFEEQNRTDANKVNGCVSQVWLNSTYEQIDGQTHITYSGDSDAMIVKGLVAILLAFCSGQSARWIVDNDALAMFDELGLREHLTTQRANGLTSMVERIRSEALSLV